MKGEVAPQVSRHIDLVGGGLHLPAQLGDFGQISIREMGHGLLGQQTFEGDPGVADFAQAFGGHHPHPQARGFGDFKSVFGAQALQGFAYRHGAGTQRFGQATDGQFLPGLKAPAHQRFADLPVDLVLQGIAGHLTQGRQQDGTIGHGGSLCCRSCDQNM
ncbi:hypothetical protein D3C79_849810 [compost metagenome]